MAHDVFVSYSHHDKLQADAVCATLEAKGIRCGVAPRDVIPGQEWGAAIVDAIQSSRVMVLVFSSHANTSPQIRREVQLAVDAEAVLIPFRIEDVAPTQSLKYYLGTPHWLDALTSPLEAHVERLAVAVTSFLVASGTVGSSAGSVTTPQSGLGTDTDPTAPPGARGGEHRIEQGIPAPESAAANEQTTREDSSTTDEESRADRLAAANIASTPGQSDAPKSGPTTTGDRLAAAASPTDTSTEKARLFERLSRRTKIALATGIVVSVVAIVVGVVLGSTGPSSQSTSSTPTITDTPDSTPTATDTPAPDPVQQLQAFKERDAPAIAQVVGQWIPQLSSKHGTEPWTYDPEDNVTYEPAQILQEHQQLRQQYGAKLLWSGDWTTYDQPDYWVTVVPTTYSDSDGVLNWCRSVNRDPDHCSAQIVSKTLGPAGAHADG